MNTNSRGDFSLIASAIILHSERNLESLEESDLLEKINEEKNWANIYIHIYVEYVSKYVSMYLRCRYACTIVHVGLCMNAFVYNNNASKICLCECAYFCASVCVCVCV